MTKNRFLKIHKMKPILFWGPNQVIHLITKSDNPQYLGSFLGKDILYAERNNDEITKIYFSPTRYLINVEVCGDL